MPRTDQFASRRRLNRTLEGRLQAMGLAISILRDVRRRSQVDWYVMEGVAGTSRYHQAVIARLHLARLEQQVGCPVEFVEIETPEGEPVGIWQWDAADVIVSNAVN